jgi:acetyl-CoA carboxylase carboxyltransferase component
LWVDRVIAPDQTRQELIAALSVARRVPVTGEFKTGVLQV